MRKGESQGETLNHPNTQPTPPNAPVALTSRPRVTSALMRDAKSASAS